MTTHTPKVSFILTTFNCADPLQQILDSIEMQDYPDIEINIKDGMSTDGTLDIINTFKAESRHQVNIESKKDLGIYDAMNQGYELSTGDIIVFCSDKLIRSDAVSHIIKTINEAGKTCIGAHADLIYANNGTPVRIWKMGNGHIKDGWMVGHPTMYLRREIYQKYGLYKTDYRIAADYEFMARIFKDNEDNIAYLPETIVEMSYGGTSTATAGSYWSSLKEANKALKENGYKFPWIISFRRTLKLFAQFLGAKFRHR
ncbi:MAG: glycosyltransferase [Clostridiales bacterium]|nr:glycosyltransferase [Clostridiales bacterium]